MVPMGAVAGASVLVLFRVKGKSVYSEAQLYGQLNDAVSSGSFNSALWTRASSTSGAAALQGCTSSAVIRREAESTPMLSLGEIVGAAVGSLVALVLLVLLVIYFVRWRKADVKNAYTGKVVSTE